MPDNVGHERRRKRRVRVKSTSSHSHRDHAPARSTVAARNPTTVEELREARVRRLASSPFERSMKYEYVKTVPVKVRAPMGDSKLERTKDVAVSRTKKKSSRRSIESTEVKAKADERDEDDAQYVYARSAKTRETPIDLSRDRESAKRSSRSHATPDEKGDQGKSRRRTHTRRHTAPVVGDVSQPGQSTIATAAQEPESRDHVPPLSATRPPLKRSSTSARPRSEVSIAKSSASEGKRSILSSLFAAKPSPPSSKSQVSCLTCGDEVPKTRSAKLPCSHRMCHACLKRLFKMSVSDPAHMPPRCCTEQHIDLKHVDSLFDQDFKKTWNHKFKEYKAKNRIYCPKRGCGEWIQPKYMTADKGRKTGKCPTCKTIVCGICSQYAHRSKECPKDPLTLEFHKVAKKAGWQKCYNCSAMVELKEGCNHMTCRCTAEFCMVCGQKWKSCDCAWFNYDALDHQGDPVRYQQEIDRRREQERRDEAMARRLEELDVTERAGGVFGIGFGNGFGHHLNQNFIQQAREALTARYTEGHQAARGLLNGFFMGRDTPVAAEIPAVFEEDEAGRTLPAGLATQAVHDPAEGGHRTRAGVPVRRHTSRRHRPAMPAPLVNPSPTADLVATPEEERLIVPEMDTENVFEQRAETAAERAQNRRIRAWANDIATTT